MECIFSYSLRLYYNILNEIPSNVEDFVGSKISVVANSPSVGVIAFLIIVTGPPCVFFSKVGCSITDGSTQNTLDGFLWSIE